jgi:hypothetical protein
MLSIMAVPLIWSHILKKIGLGSWVLTIAYLKHWISIRELPTAARFHERRGIMPDDSAGFAGEQGSELQPV